MSLYDNGIRISTREADATLEYQQTNVCITRQMTEDEKARYRNMDGSGEKQTMAGVTGMTTKHRGPKPRERRYCPSCQAEMKLREEQLKEPLIKCLKCAGDFETDLWSKMKKTQNQGDGGAEPSTEGESGPDPYQVKHLQPEPAPKSEPETEAVIPPNLQIAQLAGEIIHLTNRLKKEGFNEGFLAGYGKGEAGFHRSNEGSGQ